MSDMPQYLFGFGVHDLRTMYAGNRHTFVRVMQSFHNSLSWTVHPMFCDGVMANEITILNPRFTPNTDGFVRSPFSLLVYYLNQEPRVTYMPALATLWPREEFAHLPNTLASNSGSPFERLSSFFFLHLLKFLK